MSHQDHESQRHAASCLEDLQKAVAGLFRLGLLAKVRSRKDRR